MEIQNVVFRVFPDGQVIALLCGTSADCVPGCVMSYMHIGQHGDASRHLGRSLRLATPAEYSDLLKEMQGIYAPEYKIIPVNRLKA